MKLKIIYRNAIIWNVILQLVMSFLFILLQEAILKENSLFNPLFLKKESIDLLPLALLSFCSLLLVFNIKKLSLFFYIVTVTSISVFTTYNLISDFSKLVLIVLFVYILTSYYLYFLLQSELDKAYYNCGFTEKNLFEPMLYKIPVEIIDQKTNARYSGVMTNWDEEGCFVKLDKALNKTSNLQWELLYLENVFKENVSVVTVLKDRSGVGLKFKEKMKSQNGWQEFYKIITDMGLKVEYVQ